MHIKGPPCHGHAQNQTAGTILVLRIVFDNLSRGDCLTQLLNTYIASNALINRMFRILEGIGSNLLPYLLDSS